MYEQYFLQIRMVVTKRMCFCDRGAYDEAKKFLMKNISAFYYDINVVDKTIEYHQIPRPIINIINKEDATDLFAYSTKVSELGCDPARP